MYDVPVRHSLVVSRYIADDPEILVEFQCDVTERVLIMDVKGLHETSRVDGYVRTRYQVVISAHLELCDTVYKDVL